MRSTLPTFNEVWQRQFRSSVLKQIQAFPSETSFLVGCSGGMDSMLLLHLMSVLSTHNLRAIYVDHQLQQESASWGVFVAEQCADLKIPYIVECVNVADGNLENQAREARYHAYSKHLKNNEVLVLAHHQQDQAETVILRLLSGAGVQGLSAMKSLDSRKNIQIWRPFLDLSREQIQQWTAELNLQYIDDPSNADTYYDRAWCREELWQVLQKRFPQMQQALSRTSYLMQDADEILQDVLQQDLQYCATKNELNLTKLLTLSEARQRQLLSAWMKGNAQYRPAFQMVERLQNEVIHSKVDAQAVLHWNDIYYVRYQQRLFRLEKSEYLAERHQIKVPEQSICFQLNDSIALLSGTYQIQLQDMGLSRTLLGQKLTIMQRQGGEKIHLNGRVGSWSLKKAIQQAQIFPWHRHRIQILTIDNVMLGVFTPQGFWLAQSAYCESKGWQPNLVGSE